MLVILLFDNVRSEVDASTAPKSIAAHVSVMVKDALARKHGEGAKEDRAR